MSEVNRCRLSTGADATRIISYYQTKTGLVLREFDLKAVPALWALLQEIPEAERWGAVIKAERQRKYKARPLKEAWHARHYAGVFREIARRAGLPDHVWSMDMRAGGGHRGRPYPRGDQPDAPRRVRAL